MSSPPPVDHRDLAVSEVKYFFDLAKECFTKTDTLLSMHYKQENVVGPETLTDLCELLAVSQAFEFYLYKNFKRVFEVPETAKFRASSAHILAISKMILTIADLRKRIATSSLSIETH